MHPFFLFIKHYVDLPQTDWEQISACLRQMEVRSGHILLTEGQICRHFYFLETGLLRFYVLQDGIDYTKYFTEAPYAFTSQLSFTERTPAKEHIEALEDSVLWQMSNEDAFRLLALPSWSNFIRKLIQEVQGYTEDILQALQTQTAEQRYATLLREQPELLQRVPLKHLASYLGIAPQSLSRIRRKLSSDKSNLT